MCEAPVDDAVIIYQVWFTIELKEMDAPWSIDIASHKGKQVSSIAVNSITTT